MLTKSIRWRIQLWLAFLLVSMLTGFGVTVCQLYRVGYFDQLDDELARRVAALSNDVRMRGPGGGPGGPRGFGEPGKAPPSDDHDFRPFRGPGERFSREPGGSPPGPPPFDRRGGKAPFDGGWERGGPRHRGEGFRDGFEGWPRREVHLSASTTNLFDQTHTNAFYFALWSRSGALMRASSNAPAILVCPASGRKNTQPQTFNRGTFRETYQVTELGDCILAGRWIGDDLVRLDRFTWTVVGAGLAILALGLTGSWSLARQAVRPVEQMSATASRISAGNLSERISVQNTDGELGHLAEVLNSTFSRLESAFAQQKQFTADASHELRTPLAIMISEAQTTLARPRDAAEYRETVQTCLEAAQEMRRLTDSMLQLARLEAAEQPVEKVAVDLAETARHAIALVQPLADAEQIRLIAEFGSVQVLADAGLLTQVITNLLNNAIHYNKPGGEVRLKAVQDGETAILSVSDTGVGIPPEDLPHIFERFYRGDKSRSSPGGRMGLGLAICKTIVDLHHGVIEVSSQVGVGTEFVVRLKPAQS